jgi:hypothetical protein
MDGRQVGVIAPCPFAWSGGKQIRCMLWVLYPLVAILSESRGERRNAEVGEQGQDEKGG